jgi:hypothetical protein
MAPLKLNKQPKTRLTPHTALGAEKLQSFVSEPTPCVPHTPARERSHAGTPTHTPKLRNEARQNYHTEPSHPPTRARKELQVAKTLADYKG